MNIMYERQLFQAIISNYFSLPDQIVHDPGKGAHSSHSGFPGSWISGAPVYLQDSAARNSGLVVPGFSIPEIPRGLFLFGTIWVF
jgi:hypothetical protein